MISFIFLLLIRIVFSTTSDIKLSGNLTPQTPVSNGDTVDYKFKDASKAVLTLNQPIISMNGGVVSIDGDDKEVVIEQNYCVDGISCSDPGLFLMDITGDSTTFSMNDCEFKGRDKYVSVMYAHNTQQIMISECKVSGTLFMFAKVSDTNQMTISDCEFKNNIGDRMAFSYPFYGSVLTLVNCSQLTLAKCKFKKVDAGTYDEGQVEVSGGVVGYAAPVFIQGSQQATLSDCKFEECSGLLAGAIFSYEQGDQCAYNKLEFFDNSYTLPVNNLTAIIETIPGIGTLVNALKNYTDLGNDLTRIGGTSPSTHRLCSSSDKPHFRNDLATESFDKCGHVDAGGIVAMVLGSVAVVVVAAAILLCCCCGCCCRGCYERCCCGRCCYRQRCKRTLPSDYETPSGTSTNTTSDDHASQQDIPPKPNDCLPQSAVLPYHQDYNEEGGQNSAPQGYLQPSVAPPQGYALPGGAHPALPQPFLLPEGYPLPPQPQYTQEPQEKEALVMYPEDNSSSNTAVPPYNAPYGYPQPQTTHGPQAQTQAQSQAAPYNLPQDAYLQPQQQQRGQTQQTQQAQQALPTAQAQVQAPQYDVHDFYTQPVPPGVEYSAQEGYEEGY